MNNNRRMMSIVSILLGIASILWYFAEDTRFMPFVLAVVGLVIAVVSFMRDKKDNLAKPALIVSLVGIVLTSARFIGCIACASLINKGLGGI